MTALSSPTSLPSSSVFMVWRASLENLDYNTEDSYWWLACSYLVSLTRFPISAFISSTLSWLFPSKGTLYITSYSTATPHMHRVLDRAFHTCGAFYNYLMYIAIVLWWIVLWWIHLAGHSIPRNVNACSRCNTHLCYRPSACVAVGRDL